MRFYKYLSVNLERKYFYLFELETPIKFTASDNLACYIGMCIQDIYLSGKAISFKYS